MADQESVPPGWYPDPTGRHELRYWAQSSWQASVSDQNRVAGDPVGTADLPPPANGPGHAADAPSPAPAATPRVAAVASGGAAPAAQPTPIDPRSAPPASASVFAPTEPQPMADPAQSPRPSPPPVPTAAAGPAPGSVAVPPPGSAAAVGLSAQAAGRPVLPTGSTRGRRLRTGAPGPVAVAVVLLAMMMTIWAFVSIALLTSAQISDDFGDAFATEDPATAGDLTDASDDLNGAGLLTGAIAALLGATAIGLAMTARWAQVVAIVLSLVVIGLTVASAAGSDAPAQYAGAAPAVAIIVLLLVPSANRAFARRAVDDGILAAA